MTSRQYIEDLGLAGAGVIEEGSEELLVRVLGEIPMYVRRYDESVTPSLMTYGYWEAWITAWLFSELAFARTFIDIGANTGYYSFIASRMGVRTIAFEPNPDYSNMIKRSSALNGLSMIVHEAAVADFNGAVELTVPSKLQGSATIRNIDLTEFEPTSFFVPATSLDSKLKTLHAPVVIKVDAEGAEEMIWNGCERIREEYDPTFLIEYTPGSYSETFIDELQSYGEVRWIDFDGLEQPITKEEILAQQDWIMLVIRKR